MQGGGAESAGGDVVPRLWRQHRRHRQRPSACLGAGHGELGPGTLLPRQVSSHTMYQLNGLRKSTPPRIRQLIDLKSNNKR